MFWGCLFRLRQSIRRAAALRRDRPTIGRWFFAVANRVMPAGATFEGTLYRAVGEGHDPLLNILEIFKPAIVKREQVKADFTSLLGTCG